MYLTIAIGVGQNATFYYVSKSAPESTSAGRTEIPGTAELYENYDDFYHCTAATPVSDVILNGFAIATQKMVVKEED